MVTLAHHSVMRVGLDWGGLQIRVCHSIPWPCLNESFCYMKLAFVSLSRCAATARQLSCVALVLAHGGHVQNGLILQLVI